MEMQKIIIKIDTAIKMFIENEFEILQRSLNELYINNRFADYLKPHFKNFDVDIEYNGDIDKPNDRKALLIAQNEMQQSGLKINNSNYYKINPDIIIHKIGSNKKNLVVFEVKKDSNSKKRKLFDIIKLKHLTTNYDGNHYNYMLGIALIFGTKENAGQYEVKFFHCGKEFPKEEID